MSSRETLEAMHRQIEQPIILIGAGRSGTSLLGNLFSRHVDVAYCPEPRPIWMHGNAYRDHHALGAGDLTPRIASFIDGRFHRFLKESGRKRFAEKTPSNCLRIPFIRAVYPDCQIIHVIRDGRDVVRSTLKIRERRPRRGILVSRMRETPLSDWPSYIPMLFRTYWRTNILGVPASHWGANPPGWRSWADLPPHLAAARQWKELVETVLQETSEMPASQYLEFRYEDLVADPPKFIALMLDFVGLPHSSEMLAFAAERIDSERPAKWRSALTQQQEREVENLLEPLLIRLGYLQAPRS